jgi:hypothetical protein
VDGTDEWPATQRGLGGQAWSATPPHGVATRACGKVSGSQEVRGRRTGAGAARGIGIAVSQHADTKSTGAKSEAEGPMAVTGQRDARDGAHRENDRCEHERRGGGAAQHAGKTTESSCGGRHRGEDRPR